MVCLVLSVILAAGATQRPAAQTAKPDFSGRWVLDAAKSDFGGAQAPTERVDDIKQTARRIDVVRTVTTPGGARKVELQFDLTGAPTKQTTPNGEFTATVAWKGRQLVTTAKGKTPDGSDLTITDTWELSADRKQLTVNRTVANAGGGNSLRFVFARK